MGQEKFTFKGSDKREVCAWLWGDASEQPAGVLQIFHGMAEHAARYTEFAQYLNTQGIFVYACDQRGHGLTGEMNKDLSHLESGGFNGIIKDQRVLSELIREKHPNVPLFILGHSFGSFLAQEYTKRYADSIAGVILTGSSLLKSMEIKAGLLLVSLSMLFGKRRQNRLLDLLVFGSYNRRVSHPASKFSWLSRDMEQVLKYEEDPFCGMVMSTGFFHCFFTGLSDLFINSDDAKIKTDLPICILSGGSDPVGKYGTGTTTLYERYRNAGCKDIFFKLYKGARHEIINEINREEVYREISAWLNKCIAKTEHFTNADA